MPKPPGAWPFCSKTADAVKLSQPVHAACLVRFDVSASSCSSQCIWNGNPDALLGSFEIQSRIECWPDCVQDPANQPRWPEQDVCVSILAQNADVLILRTQTVSH